MNYARLINNKVAETIRKKVPFSENSGGKYTYQFSTNHTSLNFHTSGLGDKMIVRQVGRAFMSYVSTKGDPNLGPITIINGGYSHKFDFYPSDTNIYWWYSFGPMDDDPGRFYDEVLVSNLEIDIDLILCGSKRIQTEAEQLGYDTLYFPIGFHGFEPLGLDREGFGYAGSVGHKSDEKTEMLLGPFMNRPDFEWVTHLSTPEELNLWYNTRFITFGLTKAGQHQWGVVNSRVFESLGSGTPLIIREHPTLDDVLGFEYPYQATDSNDAREMVDQFTAKPSETLAEFEDYARTVRNNHDYTVRLEHLFSNLS